MTFVKGPILEFFHYLMTSKSLSDILGAKSLVDTKDNLTLGIILLIISVTAYSAWISYQAWVFKDCPAQLVLTALMLLMGTVQCSVIAVSFERSAAAWRLAWNYRLLTYIYSGVFCSAIGFFIQSWCINKRGPIFAAAFYPLSSVITAILEPIFLHVDLYVGSAVGMAVIIVGLYVVLWGKAQDSKGGRTKILHNQMGDEFFSNREGGERQEKVVEMPKAENPNEPRAFLWFKFLDIGSKGIVMIIEILLLPTQIGSYQPPKMSSVHICRVGCFGQQQLLAYPH
ncbi:hypothetical protein AMTR_s00131p00090830 [Amborella trichopoda]|uniref:WAT1-related protein n=1 Tax=Amborella trichopoda TaxID=13333 RepID=W1NV08_AMBTC|nr:hypothetical protein AMTR_s00131p00090830 [Amborella trichopoda]